MRTIQVKKKFTLNLAQDDHLHFEPGVYNVEDHIADHWYTKQHIEGAKPIKAANNLGRPLTEQPKPVDVQKQEEEPVEDEGEEEEADDAENEAPKSRKKRGK